MSNSTRSLATNLADAVRRLQRSGPTYVRRRLDSASYALSAVRHSPYFYISHHKCATQYARSVISDACRDERVPCNKYTSAASLRLNKVVFLLDFSPEFLDVQRLSEARGVHCIRDPRDILVSMYFSHRDSHTAERGSQIYVDRHILRRISPEAGFLYLLEESDFWKRVVSALSTWNYADARFYETSYERLISSPTEEWTSILSYLGLSVNEERLTELLDEHSFEMLQKSFARRAENFDWAQGNHYRSGKAGGWREHIVGAIKERFQAEYGSLLVQLGYEKGDDW